MIAPLLMAIAVALFLAREQLLQIDYGTNYTFMAGGLVLYVLTLHVAFRSRACQRDSGLIGLPKLAPDQFKGQLLQEGIYGRIRHPRYVGRRARFDQLVVYDELSGHLRF